MVKAGPRFIALLAAAALPLLTLSAKELADYQVGETAEQDIVATSPISVVDPDATEELKAKEAIRVLAIVRYDTNAEDEVEQKFRQAFARTREDFLDEVAKGFGHRTLSPQELNSFKFQSLAILFQKQNQLFPLSTNRAAAWAGGDADEAYESALISALRQSMSVVIRPEPPPEGILKMGNTVRLVAVADLKHAVTSAQNQQSGKYFSRSNFVTLAEVKKEFRTVLPPDDQEAAKYAAGFLRPNCAVDERFTRGLREKRTEGLCSMVTYEPGQVIAHNGQVIDKKIKAAIDQLKERAVVGQLQELQARQQAAVGQLQQLVANDRAKGAQAQEHVKWLIGALAAVVVILALAIWQLSRRKQTVALVPAAPAAGELEWQQRALVAEQRNQNLQEAARAGFAAHFSRWLSSLFTRRLISQRRQLLENQNNAAAEMAELEARLQKVQAPLQERLAAYERRIGELEKELAARGEENRELLKAKIEMMRRQLELERNKNRLEFN